MARVLASCNLLLPRMVTFLSAPVLGLVPVVCR